MADRRDKNPLTALIMAPQFNNEYWAWATYEPTPPNCPRNSGYDSVQAAWGVYDAAKAAHDGIITALEAARAGDVAPILGWMAERLKPCGIYAIYGILHDKDKTVKFDTARGERVNVDVEAHVQTFVMFQKTKEYNAARTQKNIAAALGIAENNIERPHKGRYEVDNQLAYLVHIKYKDKHQYSPNDVVSIIPEGSTAEPYAAIYARRYADWMRGRGEVSKKKAQANIEALIDDITSGKVTKQQVLLREELFMIYVRNRKRINDAFASGLERKILEVENDMKAGKFRLSVFFVTGEAGQGKSLFADFFAAALQRWQKETNGEDWQIYDAAATNGMDDYMGEEILLLDDLRAGAMRAEDWLRLLDNHRTKAASARFYNKVPICKTLVITSIKEPFAFFDDLARTSSEDLNQFIRRVSACVKVVNLADYFPDARLKIGEVKRVNPFEYGVNEKPLVYNFVDDKREYSPLEAVKRLLGIVKKSSIPAPPPFPEGWETAIFEPLEAEEAAEEQETFSK